MHWIGYVAFIQAGDRTMLILLIILTGLVAGILPGALRLDKKISYANIAVGLVGALAGAFLVFGDTPLLLKYPFLNEKTLMIAVSFLFVFAKVFIRRIRMTR